MRVLLLAARPWRRTALLWSGPLAARVATLPRRLTDAAVVGWVLVCLSVLGSVWALGSRISAVARQRERWERLWLR